MATLMYAPGLRVRIATASNGILDVSDDIVRGDVQMAEDSLGSMNLVLKNHRRKYDGVFTPNDRISVQMKRIAWVQVFAGYLNDVPFMSVFARDVVLSATCTLKRLQYHFWDSTSDAAYELLDVRGNGAGLNTQTDGGIRDRVMRLLTEVVDWPANRIHIGALPPKWFETVTTLGSRLADRLTVDIDSLGNGAATVGFALTSLGRTSIGGEGPFTGALPDLQGKISWFGGPGGGAPNRMALTGESGIAPSDPWYCGMRWPYQGYVNGRITGFGTPILRQAAIAWWRNRKILVVNPATNKAVVLRAADWGPGGMPTADNRVVDVSRQALATLGATTNSFVYVRFAETNLPLGEVTITGRQVATADPLGEPHPIVNTAATMQGPTGLVWTSADNLQSHVTAARQFIRQTWEEATSYGIGGHRDSNIAGTNTRSDHSFGLALDVLIGAKSIAGRTPAQLAYGTSVAAWFVQNPNVFGVKYVIWNNKIIYGDGHGWGVYMHNRYVNDINLGHFNHVHISFKNNSQGAPQNGPGAMGSPWVGADMAGFPSYTPAAGGVAGMNLINSYLWTNRTTPESTTLSGIRALMNDEPILGDIKGLTNASMRSLMAAPNGDFIAWFPDYFGVYKTAGRMKIKDIELAGDGFSIMWSDARLKTHMYATGSWGVGSASGNAEAVDASQMFYTAGIATVEYPEIMEALFNISPSDPRAAQFLDSAAVFARYGARPERVNMGAISGPIAEFWLALHMFQKAWAQQFSATVDLTFMPEVYPGMLLMMESYGFQVYVTSVQHSFDFTSGFFTRVTVIAPSALDGSGLFGLPRAVINR